MIYIQLPNGAVVDNATLIWLIPLALIILALFQLLYITFLRYAPTRREPRPPEQPIMPAIYAAPNPPGQPAQAAPQPVQVQPVQQMPAVQQPVIVQQQVVPVQAQPVAQPQRAAPPAVPAQSPARSAVVGMGKFVIISGLDSPKEIAIPAASFFVGRFYSPENNVLVGLDEKSISRKHAQFTGDEFVREYYLKDSNSSFGTYILINGNFEQLSPDRQERVYNEDVVQFGNIVTIRLMLPCESRSALTNL